MRNFFRLKKWHMCHFFSPDLVVLPLIILDEPIEMDVAVPAGLAEILAYLLLDGGRDEALNSLLTV